MPDEPSTRPDGQWSQSGPGSKINIPMPLTPLVGREQEVQAICTLLRRPELHLLTLSGTGGIGKTRLSIQVALALAQDFPDGAYFVSLASANDSELVVLTLAQTLGMGVAGERPLFERLKEFLHDKSLLLLLDNFEQVVQAAPLLVEILIASPQVKMLVTSRALLRVRGEYEFSVPPLVLPDTKQLPDLAKLAMYPSVELFVQRASAVKSSFQLNESNAAIVAQLCVRLEGLPLAIELAAAHIKVLPPKAMLERLSYRLSVLTGGARDLPERQQTLRNTIKWSYELLTSDEQRLFRRLSIFVGGCTLDGAEKVCGREDMQLPVFDGVTALMDKSLLQQIEQSDEEPRLFMLETIREYGRECLVATGELETMQRLHAHYTLDIAEEAELQMGGAEQALWANRLEREHDNLRAALRWLIEGEETELALQLSAALYWFWSMRGYLGEGRQWLERALLGSEGVAPAIRAKALNFAAGLAYNEDERERVEQYCTESLHLYRELGDKRGAAISLYWLGQVACWYQHDYDLASTQAEEALSLFREIDYKSGMADSYLLLGHISMNRQHYTQARSLLEDGLSLFRHASDRWGISYTLNYLARVILVLGDYTIAAKLLEESLAISRALNYRAGTANALGLLGYIALKEGSGQKAHTLMEGSLVYHREGGGTIGIAETLILLAKVHIFESEYVQARQCYDDALKLLEKLTENDILANCMDGLGEVLVLQGQTRWAAHIWGAAARLRQEISIPLSPLEHEAYQRAMTLARTQMGETAFTTAYNEGQAMTPMQALTPHEHTLPAAQPIQAEIPAPAPAPTPIPATITTPQRVPETTTKTFIIPAATGLTGREIEVLRLVAMSLTNVQIAQKLSISALTVNAHVRSIYNKLEVNSRSAATRYAIEHKLL